MSDPAILGASAYGPRVASVRVRVTQWLQQARLHGTTTDQWTYCDLNDLGARNLVKNVTRIPGWERAARQLGVCPSEPQRSSLLLHRELSPLSRGGLEAKVIDRFERSVFDFDDVLHEPGRARALISGADKPGKIVGRCDAVIAGNSVLAEWASQFADEVSVVPSCVEVGQNPPKLSYELHDPPIAVWVGSRTTEPFLAHIIDALDQLNSLHGLQVWIVGDLQAPAVHRPYIERVQWSEQVAFERIAEADLGLMPLPDTSFTRGKCAYKLLEYGAGGLPSLGSPVGVNSDVLAEFGSLAPSTSAEWVDSISDMLAKSSTERQQIGETSRAVVEAKYSYTAWWDEWRRIVLGAS